MKQINILVLGRVGTGKSYLIKELNKIADENHNIVYYESQTINTDDHYDLILGVFTDDVSRKWLDDVLSVVHTPVVYVQTQMNDKDADIIRLSSNASVEYTSLRQTLLTNI